jgi:hypothetical protein
MRTKMRVLQAWQAYQMLMYKSQWKPLVDEEWNRYRKEWASEHPNKKPLKARFTIMIEFIKEKFANETDKMKAQCKELRKTLKDASPVNEESANNAEFQM